MMSRTLIAAAVAAACTWPVAASAARDAYTSDAGHWTVSTPSSVDESAPWKAADMTQSRRSQQSTGLAATPSAFSEVVTPLSVNESAPWLTAQQARAYYQDDAVLDEGYGGVRESELLRGPRPQPLPRIGGCQGSGGSQRAAHRRPAAL